MPSDHTEDAIDFEGRVVLVTGAGNGLGRGYALELARRGAAVVVNDLGGSSAGEGPSSAAADAVVDEISASGGRAVASYDSVATADGAAGMVDLAVDAFGRIDAVVNNAGILRDEHFERITDDDFAAVVGTHLVGSFNVSRAAYSVMKAQGYGRIVFTSSGAGMFGHEFQASYMAAKAGIWGLARAVALEGGEHGILANSVLPVAITRLAQAPRPVGGDAPALPPTVAARMAPSFVTPLVVWLASEQCTVTGEAYSAIGGRFASVFSAVTRGWMSPGDDPPSAEDVRAHLDEIADRSSYATPHTVIDEVAIALDF
jgi:NAD(P)-dependent dehydrogenase (short-subunit alcohol dehydrogenase family)